MEKKNIWELNRVGVEEFRAQEKTPLTLVLDNVRSLNNIGSMFRTADAFGIRRLLLCGICAVPPSPEIHKTALGAEESVEWLYFPTTAQALAWLRERNTTLCCLEQVKESVMLQDFEVEQGREYALVVGHEVDGVDQAVVDECDVCIEIPQCGTKHSMNVAVSAGVAMWHFFSRLGISNS